MPGGGEGLADERQMVQIVHGEQTSAQPVVKVVGMVGDVVGDGGDLGLGAGLGVQVEFVAVVVVGDIRRRDGAAGRCA